MIQEVYPRIYQIEVPLPDTPLKVIHSYFIRGEQRNLLVDTGFRCEISQKAIEEAMKQLDFNMDTTDIFLTHSHSDHCGLTGTLATPNTIVYCSLETEGSITGKDGDDWECYLDIATESGLPPLEMESHAGYLYATKPVEKVSILKENDIIQVGSYHFRAIDTSGHAPGHLCLFEDTQGVLFAGDHILAKITPNNTIWERPWGIKRDLLGEYLENLDKIAELEVKLTLTGHREVIEDCKPRIAELKEHHQIRLEAVISILEKEGTLHGADVASRMQWQIRARNWEEFPNAQKLFATGEAMSHLTHLLFQKKLTASFENGVVYYQLA